MGVAVQGNLCGVIFAWLLDSFHWVCTHSPKQNFPNIILWICLALWDWNCIKRSVQCQLKKSEVSHGGCDLGFFSSKSWSSDPRARSSFRRHKKQGDGEGSQGWSCQQLLWANASHQQNYGHVNTCHRELYTGRRKELWCLHTDWLWRLRDAYVLCAYSLLKVGSKELLELGENPLNKKVQLRTPEIAEINEHTLPSCRRKPAWFGLTWCFQLKVDELYLFLSTRKCAVGLQFGKGWCDRTQRQQNWWFKNTQVFSSGHWEHSKTPACVTEILWGHQDCLLVRQASTAPLLPGWRGGVLGRGAPGLSCLLYWPPGSCDNWVLAVSLLQLRKWLFKFILIV